MIERPSDKWRLPAAPACRHHENQMLVSFRCALLARAVEPAAVELDVQGEICGVSVRRRVDVLDVEGRLIDFKTVSRRPSCVSPDYAFQLATYRQITPGSNGEVRIDSLVKTQTVSVAAKKGTSLAVETEPGVGLRAGLRWAQE